METQPKVISFRIPHDLSDWIRSFAKKEGRSKSSQIYRILEEYRQRENDKATEEKEGET